MYLKKTAKYLFQISQDCAFDFLRNSITIADNQAIKKLTRLKTFLAGFVTNTSKMQVTLYGNF
jgi:hypothetical protein